MQNVLEDIKNNISAELVSLDLRQVDFDLMEISGATTPQEVLNKIFSHFWASERRRKWLKKILGKSRKVGLKKH